jgi:hypothetical protein
MAGYHPNHIGQYRHNRTVFLGRHFVDLRVRFKDESASGIRVYFPQGGFFSKSSTIINAGALSFIFYNGIAHQTSTVKYA